MQFRPVILAPKDFPFKNAEFKTQSYSNTHKSNFRSKIEKFHALEKVTTNLNWKVKKQ